MIKVENLFHVYEKENGEKLETLNNISFTAGNGEFLAIIGHNGSGKSTLAKHLNGLIIPQQGNIFVDGIKIEDSEELYKVRQTVGMVFQNPDNQFIGGTIEEDIAFGLENLGVKSEEMPKIIEAAAESVGMEKFLKRPPHRLSGGQKQRSAIGAVLAMKPKYIVFDEPTSMLDPKGRKEVLKVLKELNKKSGINIILITHFMDEVVASDRVLVMDKGSLVLDGTPREIFAKKEFLREIGLELPKVTELSELLQNRGLKTNNVVLTSEELVEKLCQLK